MSLAILASNCDCAAADKRRLVKITFQYVKRSHKSRDVSAMLSKWVQCKCIETSLDYAECRFCSFNSKILRRSDAFLAAFACSTFIHVFSYLFIFVFLRNLFFLRRSEAKREVFCCYLFLLIFFFLALIGLLGYEEEHCFAHFKSKNNFFQPFAFASSSSSSAV
jgi:hypothetical protein